MRSLQRSRSSCHRQLAFDAASVTTSESQTDVSISPFLEVHIIASKKDKDLQIEQLQAISQQFELHAYNYHGISIPDNFLALVLSSRNHLMVHKRRDVITDMVKVIGTMRHDNSDSLLPVKRMPMGLLEYILSFYASDTKNAVRVNYINLKNFYYLNHMEILCIYMCRYLHAHKIT